MVHLSIIEARLTELGVKVNRFFRPEINELQHILMEHEKIISAVCGRYFAGFAMLLATEQRLLLIDKKIPYLSVEDIRYDMISEIDFSNSLYSSTVNIFTVNKQHRFTSIRHRHHLKKLALYSQQRVMELRHYQQQAPAAQHYSMAPTQQIPQQQIQQPYYQTDPAYAQPLAAVPSHQNPTLPRPDYLTQSVGNAAVGATPWVITNPYARGSMLTRRQTSGLIQHGSFVQPEIS
jgi:hypothetical protein